MASELTLPLASLLLVNVAASNRDTQKSLWVLQKSAQAFGADWKLRSSFNLADHSCVVVSRLLRWWWFERKVQEDALQAKTNIERGLGM